jgi:hypothetical protein
MHVTMIITSEWWRVPAILRGLTTDYQSPGVHKVEAIDGSPQNVWVCRYFDINTTFHQALGDFHGFLPGEAVDHIFVFSHPDSEGWVDLRDHLVKVVKDKLTVVFLERYELPLPPELTQFHIPDAANLLGNGLVAQIRSALGWIS